VPSRIPSDIPTFEFLHLISALNFHRDFIGIDISPVYCGQERERIAAHLDEPRIYTKEHLIGRLKEIASASRIIRFANAIAVGRSM
jgi:hypothetical protein